MKYQMTKDQKCQANPEEHQPHRYYAGSFPTKDHITKISAKTAAVPPLTIITKDTTKRLHHLQTMLN